MSKTTIFFLLTSMSLTLCSQTKIKGFVLDKTGALAGANIIIKNTEIGTISDIDGYYEIEVKTKDTLSISYMGYNTVDVLIDNQKSIHTIIESQILLDEVVIVGYGAHKKSRVTGSLSRVTNCLYYSGINDYEMECRLGEGTTKTETNFKSDLITESLYPNPSRGFFQLNLLNDYDNIEIQVINMSGQLIKTSHYKNVTKKVDVDLSGHAVGMYIINIIADGSRIPAKKAIIKK